MKLPKIYLCSKSPRRQELLKQIGATFDIIATDVDETALNAEVPHLYAVRIAQQKALACVKLATENFPLLAADTIVVLNNQMMGKPKDKNGFIRMLSELSGNTHTVLTAVAVYHLQQVTTQLVETKVTFRPITLDEMEYYWLNYHPIDKAGGYGIQDFAAVFVTEIVGSYSNVVGLPLTETYQLLRDL